jgi:SAM-dependent methyltransferase
LVLDGEATSLREDKRAVRNFYDTFGWSKRMSGPYVDTALFADIRPVLETYYHRTHIRVGKFLKGAGEYFLDAGSGPIPHPEYLEYSRHYRKRVCLDLSMRALIDARSKLGEHGAYVMGDLTALPFGDRTFDAILSAHAVYHVPDDQQAGAARELYRTLRDRGNCVITYVLARIHTHQDSQTMRSPKSPPGHAESLASVTCDDSGTSFL